MKGKMKYLEHGKLEKIKDESQVIGEFLEWLRSEKGWSICKPYKNTDLFEPTIFSTEKLLAEYFGIDLDRLDDEKRTMIEELRKSNEG